MKRKIFKVSLCILIFILSGLILYTNSNYYKNKELEEYKGQVVIKYEKIAKDESVENVILEYQKQFNNTDIIGEISIPNTNLQVPIAHTSDNEYYLNHLLDKSYNTLGSVFLDYRNDITDRKILIYGHNSKIAETEFGFLTNYVNEDYYNNHSDIYIRTVDSVYHYKIFSVYIAIKDYRHVNLKFDDAGYREHLNWIKRQALYDTGVSVSNEDILVIQTCYYNPEGSFLIVAAKKIAD